MGSHQTTQQQHQHEDHLLHPGPYRPGHGLRHGRPRHPHHHRLHQPRTTLAALGLIKLKAAALLAITRSKRSTDKEEIYQDVSKLEDLQCVRRFLCDVASGELSAPDYLSTVESLKAVNLNLLIGSAELPYSEAVKYGSKVKSLKQCEAKYVCAQSGQQILLAAGLQGA